MKTTTGSFVVNPFKISIHVFEYSTLAEETVLIALLRGNVGRCRSRLRFCLRSTVLTLRMENEDVHLFRQGKHNRDYKKCLKQVFTQRIDPNQRNKIVLQSFIFVNSGWEWGREPPGFLVFVIAV